MIAGAAVASLVLFGGRRAMAAGRMTQGPGARRGIYVWLWPQHGWTPLEPATVIPTLRDLGITGVIAQNGLEAPDWLAGQAATLHVTRTQAFRNAGVDVCAGFGMDGNHTLEQYTTALVRGLDVAGSIMGDWEAESQWENSAGHDLASRIVAGVVRARPDAPSRSVDAPWWAPLYTIDSHGTHRGTHPNAPTAIFGRLFSVRFVQAYGAGYGDTASRRMLAWARDPSQYPSLGAWPVRPSWQAYRRTITDHVLSLLAEPSVCLWNLSEMDDPCRRALRAVKRLRGLGYDGANGLAMFQRARALPISNTMDAATSAALGV